MRTLHARLVMLTAVLLVALAVTQAGSPAIALAGVAAVVLTAALAVRFAGVVLGARQLTVGARARAHKEALGEMPEPRHPSTAGLPLTRAPSRVVIAA